MMKRVFSAPGRVEIGGNHTDHQRGCVLAAAIDMETTCSAIANETSFVNIISDGFGELSLDLSILEPQNDERGTPEALIRGVAAWFRRQGKPIGGFDGQVSSNVPIGAGLSSSAAFEIAIGNVLKGLFNGDVSAMDIALAGQYAENVFFGKPCGLMDQTVSSYGGLLMIDFFDPQNPIVAPVNAEMGAYALCVVDTGSSHADLTNDYASIPAEMKMIANYFGKDDLRAVETAAFYSEIKSLRRLGDRAVLRAMHFFQENERVARQAAALNSGEIPEFFRLVKESGQSSLKLLQNIFSTGNPDEQALTLALALCERFLGNEGAYRVHGGGFAGTVLAFVPIESVGEFESQLSRVFGKSSCHFVSISKNGGGECLAEKAAESQ